MRPLERLNDLFPSDRKCSVCHKALEANTGGSMNGVTFCTNTDCIEKAVKRALDPVASAMRDAE